MEKILGKELYEEHQRLVEAVERGSVPVEEIDKFYDRYGTVNELGENVLTFDIAGR